MPDKLTPAPAKCPDCCDTGRIYDVYGNGPWRCWCAAGQAPGWHEDKTAALAQAGHTGDAKC